MSSAELRRAWLAVHRYVGLASFAFLFIAGLTGGVLVIDKPLDAALNPDLFRSAGRVEPLSAVGGFEAARPDLAVTSFPLDVAPGHSLRASVQARPGRPALAYDEAFLGPGGQLIGVRRTEPGLGRRHIVQAIYMAHYTLLAGTVGRWLMGIVALAWLLSNVVGLYLTLPRRRPFWRSWKPMWTVSLRGKLARLLLDLHQASGLWLLLPLTVLAYTSVSMNFFDEAFTPAMQAISPARASPFDAPAAPLAAGPDIGFAGALRRAEAQGLKGRPAQLGRALERGLYQVSFTPSGRVTYGGLGPVSIYLDARSGRAVYADNPYTDTIGRKMSRALYPLHSGQVFGWPTELLAALLGLATAEQAITGAYLWLKRRGPRVAARKAARARAMA